MVYVSTCRTTHTWHTAVRDKTIECAAWRSVEMAYRQEPGYKLITRTHHTPTERIHWSIHKYTIFRGFS